MKIYLILLLIFLFGNSKTSVSGEYHDYFGNKLEINSDSTFLYNWNFDLASSWSKGKWTIKNDTIYFSVIPVFDTLRISEKDSLILSSDEKSEIITDKNVMFGDLLSGGGQNRKTMPSKLYYKGNKLYEIGEHGNLIVKKSRSLSNGDEHETWFIKK